MGTASEQVRSCALLTEVFLLRKQPCLLLPLRCCWTQSYDCSSPEMDRPRKISSIDRPEDAPPLTCSAAPERFFFDGEPPRLVFAGPPLGELRHGHVRTERLTNAIYNAYGTRPFFFLAKMWEVGSFPPEESSIDPVRSAPRGGCGGLSLGDGSIGGVLLFRILAGQYRGHPCSNHRR